jgi:hypothetical protein
MYNWVKVIRTSSEKVKSAKAGGTKPWVRLRWIARLPKGGLLWVLLILFHDTLKTESTSGICNINDVRSYF